MFRSKWEGTLATALLGVGVALAHPPGMPSRDISANTVITVQEQGKKDQKCKILKSWRQSTGYMAYEVESMETGECMTIMEVGPVTARSDTEYGAKIKAVTTQIYHHPREAQALASSAEPPKLVTPPRPEPAAAALTPKATVSPVALSTNPASSLASISPPASVAKRWVPSNYSVIPVNNSETKTLASDSQTSMRETLATSGDIPLDPVPAHSSALVPNNAGPASVTNFSPGVASESAAKSDSTSGNSVDATQFPDWRASWGKPVDQQPASTSKFSLPAADTRKPDPLRDPASFIPVPTSVPLAAIPVEMKNAPAASVTTLSAPPATANVMMGDPAPDGIVTDPMAQPSQSKGLINRIRRAWNNEDTSSAATVTDMDANTANAFDRDATPTPDRFLARRRAARQVQNTADQGMVNGFISPPAAANSTMNPPSPITTVTDRSPTTPPPTGMGTWSAPAAGPRDIGDASASASSLMAVSPLMPTLKQIPTSRSMVTDTRVTTVGELNHPTPLIPIDQSTSNASMDGSRVLDMLKNASYPSQREWAAETLAMAGWRSNPYIVPALLKGVQEDPAASVRATCIRCLCKMNARTGLVMATLDKAKMDTSPRVRQEAETALTTIFGHKPNPLTGTGPIWDKTLPPRSN